MWSRFRISFSTVWSTLKRPRQIKHEYHNIVKWFGRVGFFTKGFIYATIGGLTLESAYTDKLQDGSPQGVFILLGSLPRGTGKVVLATMLCGVCIYVIWRFWEGTTGQGYDVRLSKWKNFFRYRLSPLASGAVYSAYAVYIVYLFTLDPSPLGESIHESANSCFPGCWQDSVPGNIGIGLLAISFTIATLTQLIPALTGNFKNEMDYSKLRKEKYGGRVFELIFISSGYIGFFARALLFFLVCFLFWNLLLKTSLPLDPKLSTIAQAINSLRGHWWGKIIMGTLGTGLLIYGLFAALCTIFKIFPTPPPSTNSTIPDTHLNGSEQSDRDNHFDDQ